MIYRSLLLVLLVMFVAVSCDENAEIIATQNGPTQEIQLTSLSQEPQLERVLDIAGFTTSANSRANDAGVEIDVDNVIKVLQTDSTHQTFTFKLEDNEENSFSNLIVEELVEGYLGYILQYQYEGVYTGMETFTGILRRFDFAGQLLNETRLINGIVTSGGTSNGKVAQTTMCVKEINKTPKCLEWGVAYPTNTGVPVNVCLNLVIVIEIVTEPCPGTSTGSDDGGSLGGTYISGTGISGGSSDGSGTPVDNPDGANIVPIQGYKPSQIAVIEPDEWAGSEDGLPDGWWLNERWLDANFSLSVDQDYDKLTRAEKDLVKLFPAEAYLISKNVQKAYNETVNQFGRNGLNDKSDAFRHAYFQAINTQSVGVGVTQLFADAHESEVPSQLTLEKEMDLLNNGIGIYYGTDYTQICGCSSVSLAIMEALLRGELKYNFPTLPPPFDQFGNPIPGGDPNFWGAGGVNNPATATHGITSTTNLIRTNQ